MDGAGCGAELDVGGVIRGRDEAGGRGRQWLHLHLGGLRGDVDATATEHGAKLEFRGIIDGRDKAGGRERCPWHHLHLGGLWGDVDVAGSVADLESGDVIAVIGWSGDMIQLGADFAIALPETGGTLWTDNMLIPAMAAHKKNAEQAMNYYYDPTVAATVAAYVQYICPVQGAQEAMKSIDPTLVDNQWIFPTEATLSNSYVFMPLTVDQNDQYQRAFQKAIGN